MRGRHKRLAAGFVCLPAPSQTAPLTFVLEDRKLSLWRIINTLAAESSPGASHTGRGGGISVISIANPTHKLWSHHCPEPRGCQVLCSQITFSASSLLTLLKFLWNNASWTQNSLFAKWPPLDFLVSVSQSVGAPLKRTEIEDEKESDVNDS